MSLRGRLENKVGMRFDGDAVFFDGPVFFNGGVIGGLGQGKVIYVDAANGAAANSGKTPNEALSTIALGFAKLTANQHDTLVLIGGPSQFPIVDQLVWNKAYTHMAGIAAPTPNSRARIGSSGNTTASKALLEVTVDGCLFSNFRLFQASAVNSVGALEVSGSRNFFSNIDIQGQGNATAASGATAYSLFLNGAEENRFDRCIVGLDTVVKSAGAILRLDGSSARNEFYDTHFKSWSETAADEQVQFVDALALDRYLLFKRCRFSNFSANHAVTLAEVFVIPAVTQTYDILLEDCALYGIDEWATGDRGTIFVTGAIPAAGTAGTGSSGKAIEPS